MTTKKLTKLLALYLPYLLLGLVATNFGEAWRLAEGKELGERIMSMMGTIPVAFANPLPSLHPLDLLVGLCCGAGLRLAVYLRGKNAKKYRHGMEYGSARWGTAKDIEPFMAPKFADNIILTKTERLMMSNRPPDPKNARNKNVLVVGGSGSGKTRFWLKPNLLQMHSSYVVTDPKGSIVVECGNALLKNGYKVRILNTINFKKSMHYNPFAYVHSEKDILKLVTTLMTNTKGEGSGGDPFWEKSERLLLTALIAYLHYEAPVEEQNFATLLEMLNTMQVLEDDEEYQNPVDLLFEELGKKKPNSFAVRQYKLYKLAAGKTAKSILISCGARLAPFDIQELRDLTMYDELQLDTLGDKKTALFLIMSDTDSTFNFLISMVYTQLFNLLCDKADDVYGGKLPIHVRCLIDECANIGQIPNLEKLVATIRSREISACLVLQARSQLKAIYKDNADTIVGNMDSQIFLGGSEPTTLKDLSEMLEELTEELERFLDITPADADEAVPRTRRTVNREKVTDHHAILPTRSMLQADLDALPKGEQNVLKLIIARTLMAVSKPFRYLETLLTTECAGEEFTAKGKEVLEEGWKAVERKVLADILNRKQELTVLPNAAENECGILNAELKEGQTTPPKHFTEDTLLHAMETASADSMPEGVERQGIGTPATRAATIEKLVQKGFLERKGNKKTKVLLPTDKGKALITVMPEEIQSPEMTADWETKLLQIERGEMEPSEFMTEINTMITELVKNTEMKKGANALMKNKIIGVCPNCGANVVEREKGWFCENRECRFVLWKDNAFFKRLGKRLDAHVADKLLRDGRVRLKDCKSAKGKTYNATVLLSCEADGRSKFSLEFEGGC